MGNRSIVIIFFLMSFVTAGCSGNSSDGSPLAPGLSKLIVLDQSSISTFAVTADGDVSPQRKLTQTGTQLNEPFEVAVDPVHNEIYVINRNNFITVYRRDDNGSAAPLRTIRGVATGLDNPTSIAVDAANNELYAVNSGTDSITVYARTADGDAPPARVISGNATGLNNPGSIAVDVINNELVVANRGGGSVTVYARTAAGNSAPLRTISGPATGLYQPTRVAVDTVHNEIFIGDGGDYQLLVYTRTASGNVAPLRALGGFISRQMTGLAVDTLHDELFILFLFGGRPATHLQVYPLSMDKAVSPLRSIITQYVVGFALDIVHDELFAANIFNSVRVYSRDEDTKAGATAHILRTIASDNTTKIAVDTLNKEIFTVSFPADELLLPSLRVYSEDAGSNAVPLRVISGEATGLLRGHEPQGIAVDPVHDELFAVNNDNSVKVYSRTADGNVPPIREIAGNLTGLNNPTLIAVDTVHDELLVAGWDIISAPEPVINVYSRAAGGNVTPLRTIKGFAGGDQLKNLAIDAMHDEVFVVNAAAGNVAAFTRATDGKADFLRIISGPGTPLAVAVDPQRNELYIGFSSDGKGLINVYPRTATGANPRPLRTISGSATGIVAPADLALMP